MDDNPTPTSREVEAAGASIRERLIEVAARHFADHGIQGASQRAIQREVGVNLATVNYYFGSKEALYRAVLEAALGPIQAARLAGLNTIPAKLARGERIRAVLNAYLAPHLHASGTDTGYNYVRIIASLHLVVPDAAVAAIEEYVTPMRERYVDELAKLFPDASRNRIYEVLRLSVGLMAMAPVRLGQPRPTAEAILRLTEEIVTVSAIAFETLCGGSQAD